MSLFHYVNYREFVRTKIRSFPRGTALRISESLRVHPTHLSQVLRGDRDFTREQAWELSKFFGMTEQEAEYLLLLVDIERSSTLAFRQYLESRRDQFRQLLTAALSAQG